MLKLRMEFLSPADTNTDVIWLLATNLSQFWANFDQQKMLCVWIGRAKPNQCWNFTHRRRHSPRQKFETAVQFKLAYDHYYLNSCSNRCSLLSKQMFKTDFIHSKPNFPSQKSCSNQQMIIIIWTTVQTNDSYS